MAALKLIIGNRNYSSWSLRPWFFMRLNGLVPEVTRIALFTPESATEIQRYSASGKVPLLIDGELKVWDSLAICEYLAERYVLPRVWPADMALRAEARSLVAEMHSGFGALRSQLSMNCRREPAPAPYDEAAGRDIARIDAIWSDCRQRFAAQGPGLFGEWSLVDAFYAPVVLRFDRYRLPCSAASRAYMDTVLALPFMQEWIAEARAETEVLPHFEV